MLAGQINSIWLNISSTFSEENLTLTFSGNTSASEKLGLFREESRYKTIKRIWGGGIFTLGNLVWLYVRLENNEESFVKRRMRNEGTHLSFVSIPVTCIFKFWLAASVAFAVWTILLNNENSESWDFSK